jgi:hypothetical protein
MIEGKDCPKVAPDIPDAVLRLNTGLGCFEINAGFGEQCVLNENRAGDRFLIASAQIVRWACIQKYAETGSGDLHKRLREAAKAEAHVRAWEAWLHREDWKDA